ncbi:MAG TPA: CHAT domain-containing protein [Thermoanaerobaculia bacterium]|nr:CHAT domain-containing protein [Thermoanaerobaculia bacterium]
MKIRRAVLAILCLGLAGAAFAETSGPGVAVEALEGGSALDKAGLRPGDLLVSWETPPDPPANPQGAEGEVRTVFDWLGVKAEQAPRGTVRLRGERSGTAILLEVSKGSWDARVRPRMATDLLERYTEARRRTEAGETEKGLALWDQLVQPGERASWDLRCWLLLEAGEAWSQAGRGDRAREVWHKALAEAQDAQARVAALEALGSSFELASEMAKAEASFRSALEAGEAAWGESLQTVHLLNKLTNVLRLQNRLDEATQLQSRAQEILQRWAPDSLEAAESFFQLAWMARVRGDLEAISEHSLRAMAIQERWAPDSPALAKSLHIWGLATLQRGRFEEATEVFRRALAIQERKAPGSLLTANILTSLGATARALGDPESAVELHQRSLAILARVAPESRSVSLNLNNLAAIARDRGDLATATQLFQRAQTIWAKTAPEGLGVAGSYDSLGEIARMRGDLDEAWKLLHRSLEMMERLAPGGLETILPLMHLAAVAEARGDLKPALDFTHRALAIHERLAPGTIDEALTLQQLGRLYRRTHRTEQAAQLLRRAVDSLESQMGRLGGSRDSQATFRARFEDIYRDALEIELERGRTAEAFHLLERSRARSFLALLEERDLAFAGDLPAEIERSRQDNAARYDQTLRKLSGWTRADGDEAREALHRELSRLRRERDGIAAEIRKASPRLADLRQPQPLDLAAARKILDTGTLALSYSVGKDQTFLFAMTREGSLRVKTLPWGEERLRQEVERFLERVRQPVPVSEPDARSLYSALIGPVADLVERSDRVLIVPDGPLHRLPFGALIRDTGDAKPGHGQFLTEWKPFHTALSLTVYGTLRTSAPASGPVRLVAFGDPRYPKDLAPAGTARGGEKAGLRGIQWAALPYTRREVERIAEVYPGALLYLGEEATEERAKSVTRDARVLHFATHAHLDDRNPLDSALVLTLPEELPAGRDNGLLQVWEIFESVRLDADLVVLSACDSALGRELTGEGLIGLTRAFQYAGARSVVASLWSVADQVTAELMASFHRHRAAGLPKDEALRAAQIELIRNPVRITTVDGQTVETDASAPFFWAAFQLSGDWQ